ncbi:MAG TPA: alkaline phosphatase family protein, partial [Planctomycetaceae bacterium]|nr:alkaline phosphatase family protein [Planctomycetaceae bacterium]
MRGMITVSLLAVVWLFNPGETVQAVEPHEDRCVILVSVDGLANFYLDDPLADMPTLRKLAKTGARADGMVCSFPTVTWPNHTTLVTGTTPAKHGVIGNNYLDRKSATSVAFIPDPLFDKDQIVKVPTIYDAAHNAGLVTAGIVWPATRNART